MPCITTKAWLPAIEAAKAEGINADGPVPPDTVFSKARGGWYDIVVAMYHDQGLAPFKALDRGDGVNFTAGLPLVRTSPDHGTAYDIAGKNVADESSFRQAIYTAIDVFRNRAGYDEPLAHPLGKLYHEKRDDSEKTRFNVPKKKAEQ